MDNLSNPIPTYARFSYYGPPLRTDTPADNDTEMLIHTSRDLTSLVLPLNDLRRNEIKSDTGQIRIFSPEDNLAIRHQLDILGFAAVTKESVMHRAPFSRKSWFSDALLAQNYFPEVNELLKNLLGAKIVHSWNHSRRYEPADPTFTFDTPEKNAAYNGPVTRVHIDSSEAASWKILQNLVSLSELNHAFEPCLVPEAAEGLEVPPPKNTYSGRRWALFNVWRPMKPVKRDTLAVCDVRSVDPEDCVDMKRTQEKSARVINSFTSAAVLLRPALADLARAEGVPDLADLRLNGDTDTNHMKRTPETSDAQGVRPKGEKGHQWHYISNQQPDELFIIKIFDTDSGKPIRGQSEHEFVAGGCPHVCVELEGTQDEEPRESCEVRTIVMW